MPELPEVETIKLGLKKKLIGLTLRNIQILNPKSFLSDPNLFTKAKVVDVVRRAKVLGIKFDNGLTLLFHLKMTGQVICVQTNKPKGKKSSIETLAGGHPTLDMFDSLPNEAKPLSFRNKSTRVIFEFSDNTRVYFNDQRKFGWVKGVETKRLAELNFGMKTKLGSEPLEKEFSWQLLKQNLLKFKNTEVKVAILDQSVVAGVGNIYASEACFNAGISPQKKVKDLTDPEFTRLHQGIVKAISDGIKHGGSTRSHFVNAEGKAGSFLSFAAVYNRVGLECRNCKLIILKVRSGGRGTFYCPNCQK